MQGYEKAAHLRVSRLVRFEIGCPIACFLAAFGILFRFQIADSDFVLRMQFFCWFRFLVHMAPSTMYCMKIRGRLREGVNPRGADQNVLRLGIRRFRCH